MKHTSHPNIRKELHECFHHCERLLASALTSDNPPFSQEELAMMKHYAEEIGKISLSHDTFQFQRTGRFGVSERVTPRL